jgi:hypothetical protein
MGQLDGDLTGKDEGNLLQFKEENNPLKAKESDSAIITTDPIKREVLQFLKN